MIHIMTINQSQVNDFFGNFTVYGIIIISDYFQKPYLIKYF